MISVEIEVEGLIAKIPKGSGIEKLLKARSYQLDYGAYKRRNNKRIEFLETSSPIYEEDKDHIIVGFGALLFLAQNNPSFDFQIIDIKPERQFLSRIEIPEKIKSAPKWLVKGKDRFYFHEVLKLCESKFMGFIKLPTGCLEENTIIPLLNGTFPKIKDLVGKSEFWVYSTLPDGTVVPGRGHSARKTKRARKLYKIYLDDNTSVEATESHPFMLRDGLYKNADQLKIGDSLMPIHLYRSHSNNRYWFLDNKTSRHNWTQYMVSEFFLGKKPKGYSVHHKDHNEDNNEPNNLEYMRNSDHTSHHLREYHKNNPGRKDRLKPFYTNSEHQARASSKLGKITGPVNITRYNKSEKGRAESVNRVAHMRELKSLKSEEEKIFIKLKQKLGTINRNCKHHHKNDPLNCEKCKSKFESTLSLIREKNPIYNHSVSKIELIEKEIDVYDITVEEFNNFAILTSSKSGIFVHNSGKTECELTLAYNQVREFGSGLILVPSLTIKDQFKRRAEKYEIELIDYAENRAFSETSSHIYISTPQIVLNDFDETDVPINWIIPDEAHHVDCATWYALFRKLKNLTRSHGFSALPVSSETSSAISFNSIDHDDAVGISVTGTIEYEKTAYELRDFLNLPFLINYEYEWPKDKFEGQNEGSYPKIIGACGRNDERTQAIALIIQTLIRNGHRVIVFTSRRLHGEKILKECNSYNTVIWYGMGEIRGKNDLKLSTDELRQTYGTGSISCIICTSHAIEGLDLDAPITAAVLIDEKEPRRTLQKCGRVVRPSDQLSIIINIQDRGCSILPRQAKERASVITKEYKTKSAGVKSIEQLEGLLCIMKDLK